MIYPVSYSQNKKQGPSASLAVVFPFHSSKLPLIVTLFERLVEVGHKTSCLVSESSSGHVLMICTFLLLYYTLVCHFEKFMIYEI